MGRHRRGSPAQTWATVLAQGGHSCLVTATDDDPYRWLEAIDSESAMTWVQARNLEAEKITSGERFEDFRAQIHDILVDDRRIPYPTVRGEYWYSYWQDTAHPRGLWRRTKVISMTLEALRNG